MTVSPHRYAAAVCVGLSVANVVRAPAVIALGCAAVLVAAAVAVADAHRLLALASALVLLGWWWGSARLDALDRSELRARVDTSERSLLTVTGPTRRSRFELRLPAEVRRFGRFRLREAVLLELPLGRSPPQGAIIETVATVRLPRPAKNGFDETTWLRHHGVHLVLHGDSWRLV